MQFKYPKPIYVLLAFGKASKEPADWGRLSHKEKALLIAKIDFDFKKKKLFFLFGKI